MSNPDSTSALNIFNESDLTPLGTGSRGQYGAQVSGGTDAVRFFVGAQGEKEIGVLDLPEFERARYDSTGATVHSWTDRPNALAKSSVRMNLNSTIRPSLDVAVTTNFLNLSQRYSLESNASAVGGEIGAFPLQISLIVLGVKSVRRARSRCDQPLNSR